MSDYHGKDACHAAAEQVGIAADRQVAELEAQIASFELIATPENLRLRDEITTVLTCWGHYHGGTNDQIIGTIGNLCERLRDAKAQVAAAEGLETALEAVTRIVSRGDVNVQPLLLPIREIAKKALAAWDAAKGRK